MTKHSKQPKKPAPSASDIRLDGFWQYLPASAYPYITLARLDRPIGWWLLLLPGWWVLAGYSPDIGTALFLMGIFLIGAIVMRAAGCVINDLWDRNIDKKIARTSTRPLASGQISLFSAFLFLALLVGIGLVLLLQFPPRSWLVGLSAGPLILLYPLAKRVFGFPQAILGLTFSWGVPVAASLLWAGWPPFGLMLIYIGTVFWVIGYDTIYAIQDMADDKITGVKSSALTLGRYLQIGVALSYGMAAGCWGIGFYSLSGTGFWMTGMILAISHLGWQAVQIETDNPDKALRLFKSNRDTGLLLTAGFLIDQLLT